MGEAKRRQNGSDVSIVREIKIQGLIQWKSRSIVIEGDVVLRSSRGNDMVLQASQDLLHVSDTHGSPCRGLEIVVSCKIKVDRILETLPFLVGEKVTESGISERDGLIGTKCLRTEIFLSACSRLSYLQPLG